MTVYWILLIITAAIAYLMGSLSTISIASVFVFRKNLRRLGRGNTWLSNFRRIFGNKGLIKLLLVEIVRDLLPVLIGGWLLGIKDQAVLGRAFAGFCLTFGRVFPVFNRFKGSYGIGCLIIAAFCVRPSIGAAALIFFAALLFFKRYMSLAVLSAALIFIAAAMVLIDEGIIMTLCIFTSALVIIKLMPGLVALVQGREEKLSLEEDISYKFDQKF